MEMQRNGQENRSAFPDRRKKVCILTTVHPRDDTRVRIREARTLAKKYDTLLLVADGEKEGQEGGLTIRSVTEKAPENRTERMFRTTKVMYRAAMADDADVYHIHDTELFPTALKLKRHGKTVIYDAHESIRDTLLDRDYLPRWLLHLLAWGMGAFEKYTARRMDAVITVTPFLKERYEAWGCAVSMVCNFPAREEFGGDLIPWEQRETAACYAGARNDRARGIYEMTQAAQLSGVRLRVFGRVTDGVRAELEAMDTKKCLELCGTVSHDELRDELRRARFGLVTEHCTGNARYAYCVKMFEYMAAGMAVITSNIPLWEDIVLGSGCGLSVDPKNPEQIAEALCRLRDHPGEAEEMGRRGRCAALEKYTWESQAEELYRVYKTLTEK